MPLKVPLGKSLFVPVETVCSSRYIGRAASLKIDIHGDWFKQFTQKRKQSGYCDCAQLMVTGDERILPNGYSTSV